MRYTIQNGVEHQFSERVNDNVRFILPLLIMLAGVTFFLLNPYHFHKIATKPLTLGIYTVRTPNNNSDNASNKGSGSTNPDLSGSTVATSSSIQGSAFASPGAMGIAPSTPAMVGGRGGGDTTTPSVTPPTVTTSTGTIVCTNTSAVPIVCSACTVPVTLLAGQKALLSSNGTCTTIDP